LICIVSISATTAIAVTATTTTPAASASSVHELISPHAVKHDEAYDNDRADSEAIDRPVLGGGNEVGDGPG
tara:strand:- start:1069 stop:1281 length:213 start_codon:yes stop_codon:yes gene_type:complete